MFAAPGFPLEDVIDPTGAGDSFAGGLVGYLAGQPEITPLALRRGDAPRDGDRVVLRRGGRHAADRDGDSADITARLTEIRALYEFGASTM